MKRPPLEAMTNIWEQEPGSPEAFFAQQSDAKSVLPSVVRYAWHLEKALGAIIREYESQPDWQVKPDSVDGAACEDYGYWLGTQAAAEIARKALAQENTNDNQ